MDQPPTPPVHPTAEASGRERRGRRVVIFVAKLLLGTLGLLFVLTALILGSFTASSTVREAVLARILDEVRTSLPGTLELDARWPAVGTLVLRDLLWKAGADTLLTLERAELEVDLDAAVQRRLRIGVLAVDRADVRIPQISSTWTAWTHEQTAGAMVDEEPATLPVIPWLNAGRLSHLPDLRIDGLRLRDVRMRGPEEDVVVAKFDGSIDLDPRSTGPWMRAGLHGHLPSLAWVEWNVEGRIADRFEVRWAPVRILRTRASEVARLRIASFTVPIDVVERGLQGDFGEVRWSGSVLTGDLGELMSEGRWSEDDWEAAFDYIAPAEPVLLRSIMARTHLDTLPIVEQILANWSEEGPYTLRARGSGSGGGSIHASLDLGVQPWLQRVEITGSWDGALAHIDTFVVARSGLELEGSGSGGVTGVDARVRFVVDTALLARDGLVVVPAGTEVRARGNARLVGEWPLPDIDFVLEGSTSGEFGVVPTMTVRGRHRVSGTSFVARLPEGAEAQGQRIDAAALRFEGTIDADAETVDGRVAVELAGGAAQLATSARVHASALTGIEAEIDSLNLNVEEMNWGITQLFVVSTDAQGSVHLEDLQIAGDGGTVHVTAYASADTLSIDAEVDLSLDRDLWSLLLPDSLMARVPADTTRLIAQVAVRGPLTAPSVQLNLRSTLEGAERLGPLAIDVEFWLRADGALDFVRAPADLPLRGISARIEVSHEGQTWLTARGTSAGEFDAHARTFVPLEGETSSAELHTLGIDLEELISTIGLDVPARGVFAGSAAGTWDGQGADVELDFGIEGFGLQQSDGRWWDTDVTLRLGGRSDLEASVEVDSLQLTTGFGQTHGHARITRKTARVDLRGELALPRSVLETLIGAAMATPLEYRIPADTLAVRFAFVADGPAAAPSGYADVVLGLRGAQKLPPLSLAARAWLRGAEGTAWPGTAPTELPERGLFADLRLAHADSVWVRSRIEMPAEFSLHPPALVTIDTQPLRFDLRTRTLDMAHVSELAGLGSVGRFSGDLRVQLEAESLGGTTQLGGSIDSRRLRAELPDGSWMQARAGIRLSGDSEQPRVGGGITIEGGMLRMPDIPPPLHDTQGNALLWEKPLTRPTEANGEPARGTPPREAKAASIVPDLDVKLSIPGNVRLRGAGLDVELTGELSARTIDGAPAVVGELIATRGSYEFLGRRFQVQSGRVVFYGDLDPELDLRLATSLQSNLYFIELRGTAQEPRFELSAEPAQSEGDIVATLLFGRPIDQLDEGQTALLRQRTQEVATQLGANLLAQRIGQQIGVDVLSIQPAGEDGASSLVVGKYLSPDVLVQYEQVLEEGRAALVRIEYALSRYFKVETTASQGDHSGIELKWSRDY